MNRYACTLASPSIREFVGRVGSTEEFRKQVMKFLANLLVAVALLPVMAQAREPAQPMTDAQFAKRFQCPEALPNDESRKAALQRFVDWGAARHPDWVLSNLIAHRVRLLEANGCEETLRSIREAAR